MHLRLFRRVAFLSVVVLAACGGGGGTNLAAPVSAPPAAGSAQSVAVAPVPASASRGVLVNVHLPLRNTAALDQLIADQTNQNSGSYHKFLTPEQFRAQYGPAASDIATAAATLQAQGFTVSPTSQGVLASAPQSVVENAFAVKLVQARSRAALGSARSTQSNSSSTALVPNKPPTLPGALVRAGATVSFPNIVWHNNSRKSALSSGGASPDNRYSPVGPYWFTDLKEAYGYPSYQSARGAGRTIGIVIDSDVSDADTSAYFAHEGIANPPVVTRRAVNGGATFVAGSDESFESSLDVQQSLGSAPGAHVMLYTIPTLYDSDIFAAYTAAVEDNTVDVVNSSFGGCELYYTAAYNGGVDYTSILTQYHDLFRQGNAQGITFVASSGDSGAYECVNPAGTAYVKGVSFPASDSNVTAVGGTNLLTSSVAGKRNSTYVSENANFDTFDDGVPNEIWGSGGGISQIYAKPLYQQLVNTGASTRTVPDVSLHMGGCPVLPCDEANRSSVVSVNGGQYVELIGTSASSPEFAGLLAVLEGRLGTRLGNANYYIYALAALDANGVFRRGIPGNNGYAATPGYNYVLGNGTVRAAAFTLDASGPLAGTPGTASNP